ncbi:MAG: PorV/PorQ family protein [Bacteroidota bacterium]
MLVFLLQTANGFAGNEQRAGQAGAQELLINPWARSSGMGGANSSCIQGLEAIYLNVAGTAFTKRTELIFSHTIWMSGADVNINAFGFSQKMGETGVLSLAFMSMDFGEIDITTVNVPEGGIGTFHPVYTNIALSYAKAFSNSIYGGAVVKVLNQGISDLSATGVSLDAGIQYVTGLGKDKTGKKIRDNLKFGISMKNVGPTMKYQGDGMSFRGWVPPDEVVMTVEQRSTEFELPSLIKIGMSYDLLLAQKVDTVNDKITSDHKLTFAANFTANSFTKDQYHFGIEYNFRNLIMLRGGYIYQEKLEGKDFNANCFKGPSGGISVMIPLNKEKGSTFAFEYSYRDTENFTGVHSIGARVTL